MEEILDGVDGRSKIVTLMRGVLGAALLILVMFVDVSAVLSSTPKRIALLFTALAISAWMIDRVAIKLSARSGMRYGRTIGIVCFLIFIPAVSMLFLLDRAVGIILSRHMDLVFPANTVVTQETGEFKYTAVINSEGFRGPEVLPKVQGKRRIAVIGDSFVYGWGVEFEQTWPKIVEAELNAAGRTVEVLNLGCPGYGPTEYVEVARRAVPVLSPDVVVVGILQGDDVMQERIKIDAEASARQRTAVEWVLQLLTPHFLDLINGRHHLMRATVPSGTVRASQEAEVSELLTTFSPAQQRQLDGMDPEAYRMFLAGELNPGILNSLVKWPNYFNFTLDPDRQEVIRAVSRMASCIRQIRDAAAKVGAVTIVVSIPYAAYVTIDSPSRRIGFAIRESAVTSRAPDEVIESAARQANVGFQSVTDVFRSEAAKERLYFRYDGHFTPAGNQVFAKALAARWHL